MRAPHPLLQQLEPSPEQAPAVFDRGRDVVVTAGAGAGKTRTLVARYLALLLDGLPLRSLVAITFTKKAAREMRNRVRHEMHRYLETAGLATAEREHWQRLYTELDAARIGTIHSLCGEILRHHPAETGVDPRFEVLEEGRAALLQAQVVDDTLAWAANAAAGAELFALLGESGLRTLVATLLAQRLDAAGALAALPADAAGVQARWQAAVDARRAAAERELARHPAFQAAVKLLRETEPLDPTDKLAEQRALALAAIATGPGSPPTAGVRDTLDRISLSGGRQNAWPGGTAGREEVKAALRTLRDLWHEQKDWLTLELDALDTALAAQYPNVRAAFACATQRYAALKGELQALDFDDLEEGAVQLLRRRPDVRAYWQNEIQALLVDEFQDTNDRQRELIDILNGAGGKLFVVGDAKQSIYRFRGADVTVFRQKRQDIERSGAAYALDTSYRAHRDLIAVLNALLQPVLGTAEDPARPYVEPFRSLKHYRADPPDGLRPPYLLFQIATEGRRDEARIRAAHALAEWLVALVEGGQVQVEEFDPDTGRRQTCRLHYGHVAILCRASGSFAAYENALEAAGIPFLTVAGRGFYERPEVRDVLNALQALADPTDDLALAGLLRSPAGGLSDMALYRLCQRRGESAATLHRPDSEKIREISAPSASSTVQSFPPDSLWHVLNSPDLSFLEEEAPQAETARELVRRLHDQAGRVPVADVLKALLDETDYRAALLRAGQSRAARNLAKLLADAHTSQIVGIGAFVEYVQQLRDVGTREGEAYTITTGAVQLMTVHAAKGLEFPIVVIGDAARESPGAGGVLVDPTLGVLPPLEREEPGGSAGGRRQATKVKSAAYRLARESAREQEAAESNRLLYVAATRAREMLVVSGPVGSGGATGWLQRLAEAVPLAEAWNLAPLPGDVLVPPLSWELAGQAVGCAVFPVEEALPAVRAIAAAPSVPPSAAGLPQALPLLERPQPEAATADADTREALRDPPRRVWRVVPTHARPTAPAWVVGQIVHGALARWSFPEAVPQESPAAAELLHSNTLPKAGFDEWAAAEARSCGLTDEQEIRDALRRAARMLRRFQETALYREMAGAERRFHEVPYNVLGPSGALESGSMDAVFHSTRGWVLVEFKTDRLTDQAHLEEILHQEDYVEQVGRYQEAAARLLGTRPRPILCFLNCGGEVALIEDRWADLSG